MNSYKSVKAQDYTKEHIDYIEEFKSSTRLFSAQTNLMMFIRDVEQRFITGTDLSATKFGLKSGKDFEGKLTIDLPCPGIVEHAKNLEQYEVDLLNTLDIKKSIDVLHIFEFSDGLKARVGHKRIFCHHPTNSILGVIGHASDVEIRDFANIIPTYLLRFGTIGSFDLNMQSNEIDAGLFLNEYEQEICFLFLLNWSFSQIADFMNYFRPMENLRTADTIIKKKNYICNKLKIKTSHIKNLCEYLYSIGFHKKMPTTLYSPLVGTKIL